jgi:protein phosphatase
MSAAPIDTAEVHLHPYLVPAMPAPFSSLVEVEFAARSHAGKVRPVNEDSYLIFRTGRSFERLRTNLPDDQLPPRFEEAGYVLAVADGMGGHGAGDVASSLALRTAVALILNAAHWALKLDHPEHRTREVEEAITRGTRYFQQIHETLADEALADPALSRMGTTLTAAYSFGSDLFVLHVGDSRAYLFRQGDLQQLTSDHTLVQTMVDAGVLSREEAARHRLRHVVTRALGGGGSGPAPRVDVTHRELRDGDRVLVCSDGLSGMVPDAEIRAVLARGDAPEPTAQALLDRALDAGGKDNITVLLGSYRLPERAG